MKDQFLAFIAERFPFAVGLAAEAFARAAGKKPATTPDAIEALAAPIAKALRESVTAGVPSTRVETTPGVTAATRLAQAGDEIADAVTGFFRRAAITASLTADERREILRGMLLQQASMVSFVYLFRLLGIVFLVLIPLVLIMKRPSRGGAAAMGAH